MAKALPDCDIGHPFYSKDAQIRRQELIKRLEQEEKQMIEDNRRHYKNRNKKAEGLDARE